MAPEIQIQRHIDIERLRLRLRGMTDEQLLIWQGRQVHDKPLCKPWEAAAAGLCASIRRGASGMAKKAPKEYKPGQRVIVKLSNGRIEEARVNHVIQHSDGTKLQVDFGHEETALIELWQVMED